MGVRLYCSPELWSRRQPDLPSVPSMHILFVVIVILVVGLLYRSKIPSKKEVVRSKLRVTLNRGEKKIIGSVNWGGGSKQ